MPVAYQEYSPPADLTDAVACFWAATSAQLERAQLHRVLPDGCMDIVFDFAGVETGGAVRAFVVGTMTRAQAFVRSGRVDTFGVRFLPGGALLFLDVIPAELRDGTGPLESFWRGAAELADQLTGLDAQSRNAAVTAALRVRRNERTVHRAVQLATRVIAATRGAARIERIAAATDVSVRQLQRAFIESTGITPKDAARAARLQGAVGLMLRDGSLPLARIAALAGYADQAHLTREFGELAGVTPAAYRAERAGVAFLQDAARTPD